MQKTESAYILLIPYGSGNTNSNPLRVVG